MALPPPQKTNVIIAVAAAAVIIMLAVSGWTASRLESPQLRLDRQIIPKLEEAQRLLKLYEPAGARLLRIVASNEGGPGERAAEKWPDFLAYAEHQGPFSDQFAQQARELRALTEASSRLGGGERPSEQPLGALQAYQQLESEIQQNETLIEKALGIVRAAIGMSEGEVSGDSHPVATRLEAVLTYRKADLLRRRAGIHRAVADIDRSRFRQVMTAWEPVAQLRRSVERELVAAGPEVPAPPEPLAPPQTAPAVEPPAPVPEGTKGKPSLLRGLGRLFTPGRGEDETQPRGPGAPPPAPPVGAAEGPSPASAPSPSRPTVAPTIDERLAELQNQKSDLDPRIAQTSSDVDRLKAEVQAGELGLAAAEERAHTAERRMFDLEKAQAHARDPKSLDQFVAEFGAASKTFREASNEASILKNGGTLTTSTGQTKTPRGLTLLKSDLATAELMLKNQTTLAEEIDRQIKDLTDQKQEATTRIEKLQGQEAELREQAVQAVRASVSQVLQAHELETEALDLAEGAGKRAASRARNAARTQAAEMEQFYRQNLAEGAPVPQLRFFDGHSVTLEADFDYLAAMVHTQQAEDLDRHRRMLSDAEAMGIPGNAGLLPEGTRPDAAPAQVYQASSADPAAREARTKAAQAAQAALEGYQQADNSLKQLWVLHANMAAVHYLLANLSAGDEAERHLKEARDTYERSIRERRERPEAQTYLRILEGLAAKPK